MLFKFNNDFKIFEGKALYFKIFIFRASIEKTFQDLKEEFHRLCMLAKAQKDHLSKLNVPAPATGKV